MILCQCFCYFSILLFSPSQQVFWMDSHIVISLSLSTTFLYPSKKGNNFTHPSLCLSFQIIDGDCLLYYYWPSKKMRNIFGVVIICIQFFIPFFLLIFCYGQILWMLSRRISTDSGADDVIRLPNGNKFQLARKNTIKTLLIVGLCFIICWSQNQFLYLLYNLGYLDDLDWNGTYYHFTVTMVFLNCTVNPFVYLLEYIDYQEALKELLACKKGDDEPPRLDSISSLSTQTRTAQ